MFTLYAVRFYYARINFKSPLYWYFLNAHSHGEGEGASAKDLRKDALTLSKACVSKKQELKPQLFEGVTETSSLFFH